MLFQDNLTIQTWNGGRENMSTMIQQIWMIRPLCGLWEIVVSTGIG